MRIKPERLSCKYGAPMGRPEHTPPQLLDTVNPPRLRLVRLQWVDSDYDEGGAYWGRTRDDFIWWAFYESGDSYADLYTRAHNREDAKKAIRKRFPAVKFYR